MNNFFRRSVPVLMATVFGTGVIGVAGVANAQALAQGDPPARVGRLAFEQGTVSFHDNQDSNWTPAAVNNALTSGDSLWTEPNARSEVSISGTRVRMDQSTQLDLLQVDDSTTRLQLDQGRLDIKTLTMDTSQPYEIATPRGTVKLQAQGDYYVESGSTEDPTRLGVRSGAAQLTGLNGQVLAVRAGEVGEVSGDAATPQLHTIQTAPPPVPAYWAQRDQQVSYAAPRYLSSDVVGYEDMQTYGNWSNDPQYGEVWSPRTVPDGWQPYHTGRWAYSQPYGWTWVDEQPWGFAPYHYGRWANHDNRWFWVPPERQARPVYAPALVAFIGGLELGVALGGNSQPVGWFPLGPREAYVPPYSNDRNYYNRINTDARVDRAVMDDRWQRAERHEAIQANQQNEQMANRRFATVVPASAFVGSQQVNRVALKVSADKLASAPVAAVSAPPAPTQSISALKGGDPKAQADARAKAEAEAKVHGNLPTANTRFNGVQELGRPTQAQRQEQQHAAPGPKLASTHTEPPAAGAKPSLPPIEARHGAPPPVIQGERTPVQPPNAAQPNRPGEANRTEPPKPGQPATPQGQQANRPEPPKPGQPATPQGQQANRPEPPKPAEAAHPPGAPAAQHPAEVHPPVTPAHPAAEPPHQAAAPPLAHPSAEPPKPQPPHPAAEAPHPAAPAPQQAHAPAPPPQPQHQAAPPAAAPHPPAPAPEQAHAPEPPHPAPATPAPAPKKDEEKK